MEKSDLRDLSRADLEAWVAERGLKPYAAHQIVQWLYEKKVGSFDEMSNLSKAARAALAEEFTLEEPVLETAHLSKDGSSKLVFKLADGRLVESVLIAQEGRITLCLSSQVGCAMGCVFCKTAEMKLVRNLRQSEILGQVIQAIRLCASEHPNMLVLRRVSGCEKISNIVFMGMGEPLHNFKSVVESVRFLLADEAFNFSKKRVTVSTSGLAPQIVDFGREVPARLAVSLNAATDALRTKLMPINKKHSLETLMAACRTYAKEQHDTVTFEYVMMGEMNDSLEDAAKLVRLIAHTPCKVNLIPFNEYPGSPYQTPPKAKLLAFQKFLADRGFQTNIRYSKGLDVLAACGQLANVVQEEKRLANQ